MILTEPRKEPNRKKRGRRALVVCFSEIVERSIGEVGGGGVSTGCPEIRALWTAEENLQQPAEK